MDCEKAIFFLLGVMASLATFELTERRKVRMAHRELRQALVAELEHVEVLLSSTIGKLAYLAATPAQIAGVAQEIRWFVKVGRLRLVDVGVFADEPQVGSSEFWKLGDEQMIHLFSNLPRKANAGNKVIFPVVDAVLAGRTSGFKSKEIQALSTVRWQAHLLEQDADWTEKFLLMTFTVTDPTNHDLVAENHDSRLRSYASRAGTLVRCVRSALTVFGARPATGGDA